MTYIPPFIVKYSKKWYKDTKNDKFITKENLLKYCESMQKKELGLISEKENKSSWHNNYDNY